MFPPLTAPGREGADKPDLSRTGYLRKETVKTRNQLANLTTNIQKEQQEEVGRGSTQDALLDTLPRGYS
jgi:hypothetical protein